MVREGLLIAARPIHGKGAAASDDVLRHLIVREA
jgi:hypothetical protein